MMRKIVLFWFLLGFVTPFFAQQTTTIIPSSYVAGNATVAYKEAWLPFHNPASLSIRHRTGFSLLYENKYITKELSNKVINVWVPTKHINLGASFCHFGFSQYNEMMSSLSFARRFGEKFAIGVDLLYYTVFLSDTKRYRGAFTTQVGAQVYITKDVTLAFNVFNPIFSKVKGYYFQHRLPTTFSLGFNYKIRSVVNWAVQFDKEVSTPLRWATGFEYAPVDEFVVRLGAYGYNDFRPTLGAGVLFRGFRFDVSADYNNSLGFSLLGSLGYTF